MAENNLSIIVSVVDKWSAEIKKIRKNLDDAKINLDSLNDSANKVALGFAAVGAAGFAAGYKAVEAAKESIKMEKQLGAVLESTGGIAGMSAEAVKKLATEMQRLTNFDDEAVLGAENILLTFTNISQDIFPKTTETVLNMSAALGQDLKSSAIQLGKALQDPVEGVSALRRVGVNFNDSQQEVIKNLVETGNAAAAQKIILNELAVEFGNSARAQADPILQMKNSIGDAWEAIGILLIPAVDNLSTKVKIFATETLPVWIANTKIIIQYFKEHSEAIYVVAGALMLLATWVVAVKTAIMVQGLLQAMQALALMTGATTVEVGLLRGALAAIPLTIAITVALIGFALVMQQIKQLKAEIGEAADSAQKAADLDLQAIQKAREYREEGNIEAAQRLENVVKQHNQTPNLQLAEGGIVTKPTRALIGEAGPEAVIPLNKARRAGVNGTTINIVVNGDVTGEDLVDRVGDALTKKLMLHSPIVG